MIKETKERFVIITGANSGIGKAAATKFASEEWHVIMACRSLDKGQKAQQEIIKASGNSTVQLMQLDISSFNSIRAFCSNFNSKYPKLDVLIHNAGYFNHGIKTYQFSADGLELTFATNVFGPLLMTELLLEKLTASDDARVLNAGSTNIKHFFDPKREIEFDNLRGEFANNRPYTVYKMYGDSKMGVLLLTYRMAEEYRAKRIKVYAVMTPATKVSKETLKRLTGYYRILGPLVQNLNPLSKTTTEMASCYYHVCASEEFREVTGVMVDSRSQILPPLGEKPLTFFNLISELLYTKHTPAYSNDPDKIERMWNLSREVINESLV